MSIDADEIESYLEGKPLKKNPEVTLSDNVNDYDKGSNNSESKIGQKNLARAEYIQERNKKIQFGDKQATAEFMTEQTELRQRLENQKQRQLEEYELVQEEKKQKAIQSRITDGDREMERLDVEALERRRDSEINNVLDYFNCTEAFWSQWLKDGHTPDESPAHVLITQTDKGHWACDIHRYKQTIPMQDGRLASSAYTIGKIEDHIRRHDPEMHKQAIIDSINEKYDRLIQERREKTLLDKDIVFQRELRDIDNIPTRAGGDYGLVSLNSKENKITKGQKAANRRAEEVKNEENRRIYKGLY